MENINSKERQYLLDNHPNRELIEEEILNLCEKISNTRDKTYIRELLRFIDEHYIKNYIKNLFFDEYTSYINDYIKQLDGWIDEEFYPKIEHYIVDAFKEAGIELTIEREEIEEDIEEIEEDIEEND